MSLPAADIDDAISIIGGVVFIAVAAWTIVLMLRQVSAVRRWTVAIAVAAVSLTASVYDLVSEPSAWSMASFALWVPSLILSVAGRWLSLRTDRVRAETAALRAGLPVSRRC